LSPKVTFSIFVWEKIQNRGLAQTPGESCRAEEECASPTGACTEGRRARAVLRRHENMSESPAGSQTPLSKLRSGEWLNRSVKRP